MIDDKSNDFNNSFKYIYKVEPSFLSVLGRLGAATRAGPMAERETVVLKVSPHLTRLLEGQVSR